MSARVSRAQILRHLTEAVEAGLPAPMHIDLYLHETGTCALTLRMDDNRADEVDAWAAHFGTETDTGKTLFGGTSAGKAPWRSYNTRDCSIDWHGWIVDVWATVDEPTDGEAGAPC